MRPNLSESMESPPSSPPDAISTPLRIQDLMDCPSNPLIREIIDYGVRIFFAIVDVSDVLDTGTKGTGIQCCVKRYKVSFVDPVKPVVDLRRLHELGWLHAIFDGVDSKGGPERHE